MKLLTVGGLVGVGVTIARTLRDRARTSAGATVSPTAPMSVGLSDAALVSAGIADVDPEPLTQISGEGIDPDATLAAHEELPSQRERLPVRGKNLP